MMSAVESPRLGFVAVATALAVLATACGSEEDPDDAVETEEADAAEEKAREVSLGDPGILTVDCSEDVLVASLFSAEDGRELISRPFDAMLTGNEVPEFPVGRAPGEVTVRIPGCQHTSFEGGIDQWLIPEQELLLVEVVEDVAGASADTVGALDVAGNLSVLTDEQDLGDFEAATNFGAPRYDAARNRILYLEEDPDDSEIGTFHQIDLATGETSEAYECEADCHRLWIDQASGLLSWDGSSGGSAGLMLSPDGSLAVTHSDDTYWRVDIPTELMLASTYHSKEPVEGSVVLTREDAEIRASPAASGNLVAFISDTEIVLNDNELSVIDVSESSLAEVAADDAMRPRIPTSYTLIPEGPRTNGLPVVSPEGDEVAFLSATDAGGASWYRVPVDGSEDPTEIGPLSVTVGEPGDATPIAWQ